MKWTKVALYEYWRNVAWHQYGRVSVDHTRGYSVYSAVGHVETEAAGSLVRCPNTCGMKQKGLLDKIAL